MKKIFISRDQRQDSLFKKHLEEKGFEVIARSLVAISSCSISAIPEADWVFFYSKNGVQYFFRAVEELGTKLPNNLQFACIGEGTAKALSVHNVKPDFIGTGAPETTALAFQKVGKGSKVLFPQALNSRQSIQKLLSHTVEVISLVVYKNEPLQTFTIPYCDALIFTSPMNAKAYFQRYSIDKQQKVIAIGRTTAKSLNNLGVEEVFVADEPSEPGLVKAVMASKI